MYLTNRNIILLPLNYVVHHDQFLQTHIVIRRIILYKFFKNKANRNILRGCWDIFICFFNIHIILSHK